MKTCKGYWPDAGTPCQRILSAGDHCPKAADPDHGYYADRSLDPRWDWCNTQTLSDPGPVWMKGACKHLDPEPVMVTDLVTGEQIVVARLCLDCDTQLETEWTRDLLPAPNGFERWVYGTSPEYRDTFAAEYRRRARDHGVMVLPERMSVVDAYTDDRLVFVNGPAINKRPGPSVWARTGRALKLGLVWYWKRYVDVWEAMKKGVNVFLDSLGYMWPAYLVIINFVWKAIHG